MLVPKYQFKSKDMSGKRYTGTIEAENLDAFYHILSERNQFCVSVREAGGSSKDINLSKKKLKLKELAIFSRQFATMLSSGLTVIKCLDVLYKQTHTKHLKSVILGVYEAVQKGDSLSKAMKAQNGTFPPLFLSMVESGEADGSLDSVMERMADQYEKDSQMKNKVTQALIYPLILSIMIIVVLIFMLTFILPRFSNLFAELGGNLPIPTKILIAISNGIIRHWYIILLVIAGIVLAVHYILKTDSGRLWWDKLKVRMPVAGKLLCIISASCFARTLASLFSSGMPIVQSLEIVSTVIGNKYIEDQVHEVENEVRRGVSLSKAVKKVEVFPPMLASMLGVGEESGNLDEILKKTSAFYDEESAAAIQKLISLIEPIMIIFLAVIVGFIIISIILPVFTLYNTVGGS